MRFLSIVVLTLSVGMSLLAASDSPYLQIQQTTRNGTTYITGTNVSRSQIVAYVVVAERGTQRSVFHGLYTNGDSLGANKAVNIGDASLGGSPERLYVDFVRLADGTTWGEASTSEARELAARFQK
jgi:hypothetical protein